MSKVSGVPHLKIDCWNVDWNPDEMEPCLVDTTSFATLFPRYLETYFGSVWEVRPPSSCLGNARFTDVKAVLKKEHIGAELNLVEGSMTVKTLKGVKDPFMIVKARDMMRLLARSVPYEQAARVLQDDTVCDIIKIGNLVRNKSTFVKRRLRLIGPQGKTLKALELLTGAYVLIHGNTVSVVGQHGACKQVHEIVKDTFRNIHPIYGIKQLLMKRELSKDENMQDKDWSKFLPTFKKVHQKKQKTDPSAPPKKQKLGKKNKLLREKTYSPFPPAPMPRKEDLQMESGEAFLAPTYTKRKQKKHL
eukprot:gene8484-1518_t